MSSVFANYYSLDEGEDQYYGCSKGGAITFDIYSWDEQQQTSVGGNARIINSTFDGNYVTGPGVGMGGTISYGGVSTKLLIFNSIISNSDGPCKLPHNHNLTGFITFAKPYPLFSMYFFKISSCSLAVL